MPSTTQKKKSSKTTLREKPQSGRKSHTPPAGKKRASAKRNAPTKVAKGSARGKRIARSQAPGFHGGTYISPKGNVALGVPAFWTLRQTNDDLEVESPSGNTSAIVTAFQRTGDAGKLDAREYLAQFLHTASVKTRAQNLHNGPLRAEARFRDSEGDQWHILVLTNGTTLLLATLNSSLPPRSPELRMGAEIMLSITLNGE